MQITLVVLLFLSVTAMFGEDKKPTAKPVGKFTVAFIPAEPEPEKPLGFFTLHEHSVDIVSADGSIQMTFPRIGSRHPALNFDAEAHRVWPYKNPACTVAFQEWVGLVRRAADDGSLPKERTLSEMLKDAEASGESESILKTIRDAIAKDADNQQRKTEGR